VRVGARAADLAVVDGRTEAEAEEKSRRTVALPAGIDVAVAGIAARIDRAADHRTDGAPRQRPGRCKLRFDVDIDGVALDLEAAPQIRHVVRQSSELQSIKNVTSGSIGGYAHGKESRKTECRGDAHWQFHCGQALSFPEVRTMTCCALFFGTGQVSQKGKGRRGASQSHRRQSLASPFVPQLLAPGVRDLEDPPLVSSLLWGQANATIAIT